MIAWDGFTLGLEQMKKLIIGLILVVLLLVPVSCSNSGALDGTQWSLVEINGDGLIEGTHISLSFSNGTARGSAGCNNYSGEYSTENPDILNIQAPERTEEGCISPEGVLEQEEAYLSALPNAATYEIINDNLVIYSQDNKKPLVFIRKQEFRMNPADLIGTSWQLTSMNDAPVPDGLIITLTFESDSEASGRSGVFNYRLDYIASGDKISWGIGVSRTGELPRELETYALDYTDTIARANQYNLTEKRLEIFTSKGGVLVYKPFGDS